MYLYSTCFGTFVINQNFKINEKIMFSYEESLSVSKLLEEGKVLESEKVFLKKFKNIENLRETKDFKKLTSVFEELKQFRKQFYEYDLFLTKNKVRDSVTEDLLIIQASDAVDEINKSINLLAKRLREWYSYYFPEICKRVEDDETMLSIILEYDKKDLMKREEVTLSMGADLNKKDVDAIIDLAKEIKHMFNLKKRQQAYLEELMKRTCPNMTAITGSLIGAKLLGIAGSSRKLLLFPASTIQILGAEKALFRHMKTGAKPPKYGIIFQHPLIQSASKQDRGKVARWLADKISLAAKIDYFKGEYIGENLKKELDDKISDLNKK
jgi:nucleolar protein 56